MDENKLTKENEEQKSKTALREEKTLAFWKENTIFEKTLKQTENGEPFVFYDGPPFATGLPHYGHLLAGTIKDVIPRYQTMRGRYVRRQWGWDCHGLPIENLVEKSIGLNSKKEIETYGMERFNQAARESVLAYDKEWKEQIPRTGRFVDMEHPYSTMDTEYTESIWWAWKKLSEQGFVYEGYKPMQICPRCETTLSNFEVAQGYKDIADISVTAMFEVLTDNQQPTTDNKTYVLAWTTTPWTLPGNVALAVSPKIEYGMYVREGKKYIVAQSRAEAVLGGAPYKLEREISGEELVGKKYVPPFEEFYNDKELKNHERGWTIYAADFVTDTDGTGIVHIAPAFGTDDMALGREKELPFIQHVGMDGTIAGVKPLSGMQAKPKEDPQKTDVEVVKFLVHKKVLFAKEKITHSYPHCWRCDTPLLNYAASSWFINVTDIKDKLIAENKNIAWVPDFVGTARFANMLKDAPDWAVSRARFWGAPIPVWKCDQCEKREVIGSVEELKARARTSGNTYFVMRHGLSENNVKNILGNDPSSTHHLTSKGKEDVRHAAEDLKKENIDIIISSPYTRTRETAGIIRESFGFAEEQIVYDERFSEIHGGVFNGRSSNEYHAFFSSMKEKFTKTPENGENLMDVKRRVMRALYDLEREYKGKNILIVTHEYASWMLALGAEGGDIARGVAIKENKDDFLKTAEWVELMFPNIPRNRDFEIDLHRPFIDAVVIDCACGGTLRRIPEVFDCWVESGSVPFAQFHYPFENKELFKKNFPADFIAEGIDQTRGWFYSLLVLSTALFGKSPYRHVIVNGTVLAEDGQKMSKRLQNYPDPMEVVNRYGADALRYYILSSPAVRGEDLRFSEKGVEDVHKKIIMRLQNVVSFYELYADVSSTDYSLPTTHSVLDQWIVARTNELVGEVTKAMDVYEIDRAVRPLMDFVDDLSTWYIRRSRERFKGDDADDKRNALQTTHHVLLTFSKVAAPFMPFVAEDIYSKLITHNRQPTTETKKSVHLEEWPKVGKVNEKILKDMKEVRHIASSGLEARAKVGIKVRQPLSSLKIRNPKSEIRNNKEMTQIIEDEVNVKMVEFDDTLTEEVMLDTTISDNLREEGQMRELVRELQELRKKKGFSPHDRVIISVSTDMAGAGLIGKFEHDIRRIVLAGGITFLDTVSGDDIFIGDMKFTVLLQVVQK
ncbi:MAG: class I tRNA ligase family protein [Patescibacteria group bacterium]